jgi:hypothetical protein
VVTDLRTCRLAQQRWVEQECSSEDGPYRSIQVRFSSYQDEIGVVQKPYTLTHTSQLDGGGDQVLYNIGVGCRA